MRQTDLSGPRYPAENGALFWRQRAPAPAPTPHSPSPAAARRGKTIYPHHTPPASAVQGARRTGARLGGVGHATLRHAEATLRYATRSGR